MKVKIILPIRKNSAIRSALAIPFATLLSYGAGNVVGSATGEMYTATREIADGECRRNHQTGSYLAANDTASTHSRVYHRISNGTTPFYLASLPIVGLAMHDHKTEGHTTEKPISQ